ncbi:NmrA family NAD(P)-binding protein [Streptomyces atratus]
MSGMVVFGAGGRRGRTVTAEARMPGHHVTAVVRDPEKYAGLAVALVDEAEKPTLHRTRCPSSTEPAAGRPSVDEDRRRVDPGALVPDEPALLME